MNIRSSNILLLNPKFQDLGMLTMIRICFCLVLKKRSVFQNLRMLHESFCCAKSKSESMGTRVHLASRRPPTEAPMFFVLQDLQRDIEQHSESVAAVLKLCDVLLHDADACGSDSESDSIQQTSHSLDRRWRNICNMSLERRMR